MRPSLSAEGRMMLDLVAGAARRGAELTHQLLAFARRQPLSPQSVDVSALIDDVTPLLIKAVKGDVEIHTRLAEALPPALVDSGQLENALLNLAINASDATKDGGTITIETSFVRLDSVYSTTHTDIHPGAYVLVSVRDTGEGIAPEAVAHVFDPFFTTKPTGEGSGLGLAMVWGFAKQTGGHVTVYSEVGTGTTFHLYLPVAAEGDEFRRRPRRGRPWPRAAPGTSCSPRTTRTSSTSRRSDCARPATS